MPDGMDGLTFVKANFDTPDTVNRPWPPQPFDLFDVVDLAFWPSADADTAATYESWANDVSEARGLPPPARVEPDGPDAR